MIPKFKVWDKRVNKMFDVTAMCWQKNIVVVIHTREIIYTKSSILNILILMQSIGVKDKNGVEIFKEDILRTNEAGWVGKVVYQFGRFMLIDNLGGFSSEPNWELCEIIGNIHQDGHLLDTTLDEEKYVEAKHNDLDVRVSVIIDDEEGNL